MRLMSFRRGSSTDTALAKVGQRLDDLAATLACVNPPDHEQFTHQPWVRVIDFELTGATPVDRLLP